jgi:hypothetical protein
MGFAMGFVMAPTIGSRTDSMLCSRAENWCDPADLRAVNAQSTMQG